jgi:UDP-N-acetyl-D-mannosaminuronic acid dehydrogenase
VNKPIETICVLGLGYIGLPTASMLATKGFNVLGCDVNPDVVDTINRGDIHIVEQDLDVMVRSAVNSGQLSASREPQTADIYIIAVPTPFKENRTPDISYVESATRALAPYLKAGSLVILESTSPIGTTEKIAQWVSDMRPDLNIPSTHCLDEITDEEQVYIAHCSERVLPGHILRELIENDRVIGGINKASAEKAERFYQTFVQGEIVLTDARTAEMSKLTENAFRDVNIAFANELSMMCDGLDINVWELIRLANHHPRVNILQPGPGVGGHCIAVDPWFLVDAAPAHSALTRTAREVNDSKPFAIIDKVVQQASKFKYPIIACLGLSFKANIDDFRESPALQIVDALAQKNIAQLLVVEPHLDTLPKALQNLQPEVELFKLDAALANADIILLLVDHQQFTQVDRRLLDEKIVIDTRGLWNTISKEAYV